MFVGFEYVLNSLNVLRLDRKQQRSDLTLSHSLLKLPGTELLGGEHREPDMIVKASILPA